MAEKEVKEAVETEEKVTASLVKAPLTQYSGDEFSLYSKYGFIILPLFTKAE